MAIGLTMFPSSAFFFRIVPEIGRRIVQLSSRHSALATSALASADSRPGVVDALDARAVVHQFQRKLSRSTRRNMAQ